MQYKKEYSLQYHNIVNIVMDWDRREKDHVVFNISHYYGVKDDIYSEGNPFRYLLYVSKLNSYYEGDSIRVVDTVKVKKYKITSGHYTHDGTFMCTQCLNDSFKHSLNDYNVRKTIYEEILDLLCKRPDFMTQNVHQLIKLLASFCGLKNVDLMKEAFV